MPFIVLVSFVKCCDILLAHTVSQSVAVFANMFNLLCQWWNGILIWIYICYKDIENRNQLLYVFYSYYFFAQTNTFQQFVLQFVLLVLFIYTFVQDFFFMSGSLFFVWDVLMLQKNFSILLIQPCTICWMYRLVHLQNQYWVLSFFDANYFLSDRNSKPLFVVWRCISDLGGKDCVKYI